MMESNYCEPEGSNGVHCQNQELYIE